MRGGGRDDLWQAVDESDHFFYHRKVMPGYAAYTRGVQIIRPRCPEKAVFTGITDGWFGQKNKEYAEFIAYSWLNRRIAKISTDPKATANYFNAEGNSLPFELPPVLFRPEVLLKYKADRDKYTVGERDVSCRATWHLEGIDVNEAGQVHAYSATCAVFLTQSSCTGFPSMSHRKQAFPIAPSSMTSRASSFPLWSRCKKSFLLFGAGTMTKLHGEHFGTRS